MATVGDKIKSLRLQRGWTLRELSARCGVSVSHLSAIENHTRPSPSLGRIQRIAQAFDVSLSMFDETAGRVVARADAAQAEGASHANPSQSLLEQLKYLYDPQMIAFIAAEDARPYVELARDLAESDLDDPSVFLQRIATFIQERKAQY